MYGFRPIGGRDIEDVGRANRGGTLLRDLHRAMDAMGRGAQFIGGLERIARGDRLASHRHDVLFYSSDAVFVSGFHRFIRGALDQESAVIVLVTEAHDQSLRRSFQQSDVDLDRAMSLCAEHTAVEIH